MVRSDTRRRLLDAALGLLAEGGLRAVTHRAVESAAGASRGSATYHLGNRQQIVEALLEHLADLDGRALDETLQRLALDQLSGATFDLAGLAERSVRALTAYPERTIARYSLMLEAARDETLRPLVRRWRSIFVTIPEPMLGALGVPEPAAVARDLVALMDGIIFEHLSTGRPDLESRLAAALADFVTARVLAAGRQMPSTVRPPAASDLPAAVFSAAAPDLPAAVRPPADSA